MEDEINSIINELDERGLVYIRFYNTDRVKGKHGQGWRAKCVRQRPNGTTKTIEVNSQAGPLEAARTLLTAVNRETDEYLGTSGGVILTDEIVQNLADEAEKGYDPERLRKRVNSETRSDLVALYFMMFNGEFYQDHAPASGEEER